MNLLRSRPYIVIGVSMLMVLAILSVPVSYVVSKHRWAEAKLAEIEPRYARLKGLESVAEELKSSAAEAEAAVARVAYPASLDIGQAGNDAQQRARRAVEGAGMTISSSQVLPAQKENGFDRIPIALRGEGTLPQLQVALAALAASTPALTIESLSLRGISRGTGGAQQLQAQLTLFVLHSTP